MRFQKTEAEEINYRHNEKDGERNTYDPTREHGRGGVDERIRAAQDIPLVMDEGGGLMDNIDRKHRARRKIDSFHHAEIQSKESEEYQKCAEEVRQRFDVDDPIIRNWLRG